MDKGALYAQMKDYSGAEDYFTRAIALDSNNAFSYYNRGMARIKMNKVQSAAHDLVLARQKGLGSSVSSVQFMFERGIYAAPGSGSYGEAMENYQKFIEFQPHERPASFNYTMGNIYINTGKYDSALTYLVRSLQSDSSNGFILYSMASCIYLQGNTETSLYWFERSFNTNALKRSFVDHDTILGALQEDKKFRDLKKKYLQ